ncbi:MAG: ABC transporter ATP-binding protein [Dehalococcoidia bacterium]|nr:ABC transporter ATP-binding protein [Dehalococcoidia bacterium]
MQENVILKTEHLSRHFWGLIALSDVSFELKQGEILGIIGPNGAGKSTLINVLTGLFPPTSGNIHYDGKDISRLPAHIRCRIGITRTFQISRPLSDLSLLENIMTGALFGRGMTARQAREKALELCSFMGLKGPEKPISKLTALEIKKMEVARALSSGPKILLLDELMAGLSMDESDEIVDLIRKLRSNGISLCVIEHVMHIIARLTDRVIVLDWGRKLAEGPYAEVSQNPAVVKAYLGEDA